MKKCPHCGGTVERLISSPAIQFRGSGWYVTDYGRSSGSGGTDKGDKSDSSTSEKSDSKAEKAEKTAKSENRSDKAQKSTAAKEGPKEKKAASKDK